MFGSLAKKIFGSVNDRRLKSYRPKVAAINAMEAELAALSDDELRARSNAFCTFPMALRGSSSTRCTTRSVCGDGRAMGAYSNRCDVLRNRATMAGHGEQGG